MFSVMSRRVFAVMLGHGSNNIAFAYGTCSSSRREPGSAAEFVRTISPKDFREIRWEVGEEKRKENLHALCVKFMTTWQAHHSALSIYIFFKANDAFHLSSGVFAPPQTRARA